MPFRGRSVHGFEGFERVQRLVRRAVAARCYRWLADEAEDLVQTAFVRVMKLARAGREVDKLPPAYFDRLVFTVVIDEVNRRKKERATSLEQGGGDRFPGSDPDPEHGFRANQLQRAIRSCLQQLIPSRRRAATLLLLGYKNREISALMNWDPKRTENLVTRSRAELRTCLSEKGYRA